MCYFRAILWLMALSVPVTAEQVVGLITQASGAHVVRRGDQSELTAVNGDVLFNGDSLLIPAGVSGSAQFRTCDGSGSSREYRITTGRATLQQGTIEGASEISAAHTGSLCFLPDLETDPAIGMMTERALDSPGTAATGAADWDASVLAKMNPADRASFQKVESALKTDPKDLTARLSRAVLLRRNGLEEAAAAELLSIGKDWPDEQWARTLGYSIATRKSPPKTGSGKLYAAFIGISKYQQPNVPGLHYADADAQLFLDFMARTRAQVFASERFYLPLINQNANSTAVRNKLKAFFDQAQQGDSVLLYIAAHGVGDNTSDSGYVVLYDTHLESTYANSLSMDWIRELLLSEAARVSHVFLFVDTCHANRIGPIRQFASSDSAVAKAAKIVTDGKILAMYASGDNQFSFENARYGGGHGAFTYFLMRVMNITPQDPDYPRADVNGDGQIDAEELVSYVEDRVKADTKLKQTPKDDARIDRFDVSTKLPGLAIAPCCGSSKAVTGASVLRDPTLDPRGIQWIPPPDVEQRTDWEEKSQQVLYKYLQGEEVPQTEADYAAGLNATEQARRLAGESLYLEAREEFFTGRLLIFRKQYDDAVQHLEKAIRQDPASPYAFNALGIAWLELGRYGDAEAAFDDAIRRANDWAYPRHNLALVYLQRGDYGRAIATYQDAARRDPQYSYLHYNLGLIYQRLNDEAQAENEYRIALQKAPGRAAPLVALGALMADHGRNGKAWEFYRQAGEVLARNTEREVLLNLRHNEGVLEARSRNGLERARALWQANIDEADYLPSRFALARAYAADAGRRSLPDAANVAISEYKAILSRVPENIGARIEYAQFLNRIHQAGEAIQVIDEGLKLKPEDPSLTAALKQMRGGRAPR